MCFDKSVNSEKFIKYLRALRKKYPSQKLALFMDQLRVHWSKESTAAMRELDIEWILNASYSPDYNCVEGAIGVTKTLIKRERLRALAHNRKIDLEKVIKESFMSLSKEVCVNFVKKSNYLLNLM